MKIIIIEKNVKLAKEIMIPKLLESFNILKNKYQVDYDLNFEFIEGTVGYNKNGENYLLYDEHLLNILKDEYDKDPNIGLIMGTIITEQGIASTYADYHPTDNLARQITDTYINIIPIYYISGSAGFCTDCDIRFGRDLSNQYLPQPLFMNNDFYKLLDEEIEKMFLYFITNDKSKANNSPIISNHPVKKKGSI